VYFVAIVGAVAAAGVALWIVDDLRSGAIERSTFLLALGLAAALGTVAASLWRERRLHVRTVRVLEAVRTWLSGTLGLRILDRRQDALGLLASSLDTMAEQLAQDEQDLAWLREQSARSQDQLRALAVDEERERLARELHDGVKQHLFSLSMTSSAVAARLRVSETVDEELRSMVREVESTSKTVQRSLTRLIQDLQPVPLQERGLTAALHDYALLFGAREHIVVYVDEQGNDGLLSPSASEALYRVAQEALHNVARHARATRVDVRLHCMPEMVVLTIEDNGIGFDPGQVRRGLGLGNMQDRMVSVGGRLELDSRSGQGTRVQAEVVLAAQEIATEVPHDEGRPDASAENWVWLGQRLVIPVGQTWPWLPADRTHLRRPLVSPSDGPFSLQRVHRRWLLGTRYAVCNEAGGVLANLIRRRNAYEWRLGGARWALRYLRSSRGTLRAVLTRNEQPLAAMQQQGRLLDVWSEFVYNGRGYRFSCAGELRGRCTLSDAGAQVVLSVWGGPLPVVHLHRTAPLPLVLLVSAHSIKTRAAVRSVGESESSLSS
jgi:signal transduction histidine kinase